jgi:HTH-type transcriptional regulator, global nitrogen regulator NrpRI
MAVKHDKTEKKRLSILRCLAQAAGPLSSERITEILSGSGDEVSERTVRFHLLALDKEGFTDYIGKRGRIITSRGREELASARIFERVGFLSARIDQLTYEMTFDPEKRVGSVVVNVSFIPREVLPGAWDLMRKVYDAGYSMGKLVALFEPGEVIGDMRVPEGFIGMGTVCSITLNGILLRHGIPVSSVFGGLLEIRDHRPTRFVAVIKYDGTSLDPLEIFIKSGMTDYAGAIETGNGRIGASFREVPSLSREKILAVTPALAEIGLDCIMELGLPSQPLREIPVNFGNIGAIIIGGLNPVAILEESGIKIESRALSGLVDFSRLFFYTEALEQLRQICH